MTNSRNVTFADWRDAALNGYIAGGLRPDEAAAIVTAAVDDVETLATRKPSRDFLPTFVAALDLEFANYFRRRGARLRCACPP